MRKNLIETVTGAVVLAVAAIRPAQKDVAAGPISTLDHVWNSAVVVEPGAVVAGHHADAEQDQGAEKTSTPADCRPHRPQALLPRG